MLHAPSDSSVGKRKWFSKNKSKDKNSQKLDLLRAELSSVKSDNELFLRRNRSNEDEIEDLQQKIADRDKFMNDTIKAVEVMADRMKDCLQSLNKVHSPKAAQNKSKSVDHEDKVKPGGSEVQLANMMDIIENIASDLEAHVQQTRRGYASHESIIKNRSRWATKRMLFTPVAARRFQKHDTVNDLRIINIENEQEENEAIADVSDVSLVVDDDIPVRKVKSEQNAAEKDQSAGEVEPRRACSDIGLTMKPYCSKGTNLRGLNTDELISRLKKKEQELYEVRMERDILEREIVIATDFVELISKENEKHKKEIAVHKAWNCKAQDAIRHVAKEIRKWYI